MIGLLLITHGCLGESLIQCACHILGQRPPQLAQLGFCGHDDPQQISELTRRMLATVDSGAGVLVLTDIVGATPANIARQLLVPGRVAAVAGVSLPMLLRALTYRETDLATLVGKALDGARAAALQLHEASDAPG